MDFPKKTVYLRVRFDDSRMARLLAKAPPWERGQVIEKALAFCLMSPAGSAAHEAVFQTAGLFVRLSALVPVPAIAQQPSLTVATAAATKGPAPLPSATSPDVAAPKPVLGNSGQPASSDAPDSFDDFLEDTLAEEKAEKAKRGSTEGGPQDVEKP